MAGDDDSDVRQALAVFGAPPIGYRSFRPAPVPAAQAVRPARPTAPVPSRLTLQWPAQSFVRQPAEPPSPEVPSLRTVLPRPGPFGDAAPRIVARDPGPAGMTPAHPVTRPAPAAEAVAPGRGKLPLAAVFRALAHPPSAEATPLALPPMFRRL